MQLEPDSEMFRAIVQREKALACASLLPVDTTRRFNAVQCAESLPIKVPNLFLLLTRWVDHVGARDVGAVRRVTSAQRCAYDTVMQGCLFTLGRELELILPTGLENW